MTYPPEIKSSITSCFYSLDSPRKMVAFLAPLISMLGKKALNRAGSGNKNAQPKTPRSRTSKLRLVAIVPLLSVAIALLLAFLCVYAGHTPNMMEDYAVFTLNTSRIGENLRQNLDSKIESVHLKARSEPVVLEATTITAAPTTLITMVPRAIKSDLSQAASALHSAGSAVGSKATSIESAAASKISGAAGSIETNIVAVVNKAYNGLISDLKLVDFYSVHISASCQGTYIFKNGTDVTVGDSALPTTQGATSVHKQVDSCTPHSALDPMGLVRILYWIGIVCTGVALCLGLVGLIIGPNRKWSLINCFATLPAFLFIGLATAVTHGLSLGAAKLINFIGEDIGIAGYEGKSFIAMSWATTTLLLVNIVMWGVLFALSEKQAGPAASQLGRSMGGAGRGRPDRTSAIAMQRV